ncbi:site-specific DNA-methyltransferase [Nocardioides jiangxiensis]|uniref:Site-specific DNA-methyltransferase n=1 Tax=Nocardioides jiangxiensis TaxID=3064524 RepID=A0ABT9B1V2_9ACTN|nr:site-specific DNA-methyltransferase [Nocardioides sp. WY-20]MDO7868735.1 site-specific DNA-methyltransferase [Nocardioides sp. WY-20]
MTELRPDAGNPAGARTVFVEGDNLDVLPLLPKLPELEGRPVDLVYIDPPYNTGNGFAYADKQGYGRGRHEAWTAMLRPRLEAARDLMAPSGAIFVSIDDNEVAHLRLLLDEVFGERNFIAQVVVNLNPKGRQLGPFFATNHEYLLVYARSLAACALDPTSTHEVTEADFPQVHEDGRRFRHLPLRNTNKKSNPETCRTLAYPLWGDPVSGRVATTPFDGAREIWPVFGDGSPAVWRWSTRLVDERPADDLVCRTLRGRLGERVDVFQRDWLHPDRRKKLRTIWTHEEVGSTDTAVAEVKALVGKVFESPKPTGLLRRVLETYPDDAVVLDFFAGSGTTGHAALLADAADGGTRLSISVNAPEETRPASPARAAGFARVSEITEARLRAAAAVHGAAVAAYRLG